MNPSPAPGTPRSRRAWVGALVMVGAAATVAQAMRGRQESPAASAWPITVTGDTRPKRGPPALGLPTFDPHAHVHLQVRPLVSADEEPPLTARVYRETPDLRLTGVSATVTRRDGPSGATLDFEGPAQALFAPRSGPQSLWLVFGHNEAEVRAHEGAAVSNLKTTPQRTWLEFKANYDLDAAPLKLTLFGARFYREDDGGARPCFTTDSDLRVQVLGARTGAWALELTSAGESLRSEAQAVLRPTSMLLRPTRAQELPLGEGQVSLLLDDVEVKRWPACWDLSPEARPAIKDIYGLRTEGRYDEALALVEARINSANPVDRVWLTVEKGKLHFRKSETHKAAQAWVRAAELALNTGIPSEAAARMRALSHVELEFRRYESASTYVAKARQIDEHLGNEEGIIVSDYREAIIVKKRGSGRHFLEARRRYARTRDSAWSAGLDDIARKSADLEATLLSENGYYGEALELMETFPHSTTEGLSKAVEFGNLTWVRMKAMESGYLPLNYEQMRAERVRAVEEIAKYAPPSIILNERGKLAFILMRAGHLKQAEEIIEQLQEAPEEEKSWVARLLPIVAGELDVRAGRFKQAEERMIAFERRVRLESPGDSEDACTAHIILGDARRLQGDDLGAWEHYRLALDESARLASRFVAPRAVGRHYFQRDYLKQTAVLTLVKLGRPAEAFQLVETSRAQLVAGLKAHARADQDPQAWQAYQDQRKAVAAQYPQGCATLDARELSECSRLEQDLQLALAEINQHAPPAAATTQTRNPQGYLREGEVYLSAFALPDGKWATWLATPDSISTAIVDDPVTQWWPELIKASHVFVSSGGNPEAFDLPVRRVTADRVFGQDVGVSMLPYLSLLNREPVGKSGVLVVADPEANLSYARTHAERIVRDFPQARLLLGPAAQTLAFQSAWLQAGQLIFLGHGRRTRSVFDTSLQLADGQITVSDVLAERPTFDVAILAGCGTGRDSRQLPGEALAVALLATGTRHLLATTEDLRDDDPFVMHFIEHDGLRSPVTAYRESLALLAASGVTAKTAFRLWGAP